MGRITNVSKIISGVTYNLGYGYNGLGQMTSLTYPSGRIVTQGLDAIGRLSSIASGTTTYLSAPSYNAAGEALGFSYGNGVAATFGYNERLQLASLRYANGATDLLNLQYNYKENGQIGEIKSFNATGQDLTRSQNFEYDAWSRLRRAWTSDLSQQGTWRLEWDYDRFGNRRNQTLTGGQASITQPQLTISETTNRITTAGYAYDAAGNLTNDSIHVYTYDAENRIKTMDGTVATYTYSGPLRVKKVLNSQGTYTTVYIFSGSKVIAEYLNGSLSKEYVYSGSNLLATHSGSTLTYQHPDHLSTRVETDGTTAATVRNFGQYPFGEIWYQTGTASKWKFTSYERDGESGLDQAMFRYYSPRIGRFMSADPLAGSLQNPQSLNRYARVRNDPVNLVDPLGLFYFRLCTAWTYVRDIRDSEGGFIFFGFTDMESCRYINIVPFEGGEGGDVQEELRQRLKTIANANPDCADLLGGIKNANDLIEKMNLVDIDDPFTGPKTAQRTDAETSIREFEENHADFVRAEADVGVNSATGEANHIYASDRFFDSLTPREQTILLFHELKHNGGKPKEPEGYDYTKDYEEIDKKCPDPPSESPPLGEDIS